jgi:Acyl-CoA dehydrogenase, C-terminal domain
VAGTVAAADEAGYWAPGPGGVRADYGTGGWRLSGRRWYVAAAHAAGILVVPAVTESGLAMFLAETGAPSLDISRQLDLDLTRRISIITFEAVPAVLLTRDATAALARAEREFLIGTAAEAAGGIGWCLDASLAYVREQGESERLGGSFEAVAAFCVDMLADRENVAAAARYAAAATDVGAADAQKAAHAAALQAGDSYRRTAVAAIGLFGDIGFTKEHDAQLYYRRAWSAERLSGGPQAHRDALAAQLPKQGPLIADLDVAVFHPAGQPHPQDDRHARLAARSDVDVGVADRQGTGIHHHAGPGHHEQRPTSHVHLDLQRVPHDDRVGEIERHVGPRRPQFQPPRHHPLPGPLDRPSLLVDPDHLLGLRCCVCGTGHQVGRQHRQLTERPRQQGGFHSLTELISRQPPVPHGYAQHVHHPVPVRVRSPDLGRPASRRKVRRHLVHPSGSRRFNRSPRPSFMRPAGCGHAARTGTLAAIQVRPARTKGA